MKEYQPKPRTQIQNNALHLFFRYLSDELNTLGLEMKVVLKPTHQIWWTPDSVKRELWKPLQQAMFGTKSTTELTKLEQIDIIHETLMKMLIDKWADAGLEYIPFPNQGDQAVLKDNKK